MKIFAWICLAVVLLLLFALFCYLVVGAILYKILFSRRNVVSRVLQKEVDKNIKEYKIDLCWWNKVPFKQVDITSEDGLKLAGFLCEANSNKMVIVFHGFGQTHEEMQQYCKLFHDKNFNVLAVDLRAHGKSEGKCVGWALADRLDVISWVNFVHEKFPNHKIVLFGLSMGASTVCMASSDVSGVEAIISDCAFDDANREIEHVMSVRYKHVPKFIRQIIKKHAFDFAKRVGGLDIMNANTLRMVKNSKVPILFIHGLDDNFVPISNMNNLFSATPTKDKFVVEGAGHALSYPVAGVLYEKKVSDFLKKYTSI